MVKVSLSIIWTTATLYLAKRPNVDHCLTEIHSCNKYLSGPHYSPGTTLGAEDTGGIQTHPNPYLYPLHPLLPYIC